MEPRLFAVLLGLVVGSFTNVLIARIPVGGSIVRPRSRCPRCHAQLAWWENIPVLSWLLLRARCRSCRLPISVRYPVVEILSAVLYLAVLDRVEGPPWLLFARYWPFVTILLATTFIDLDHRIIPDRFSLGGLVLGLVTAGWDPELGWVGAGAGAAVGFLSFFLLAWAYSRATGKVGLGGGDVKLLAMIGAFTGVWGVLITVLISSVAGSVVGILWALFSRKRDILGVAIPYGPFLVLGGLCYFLLGGAEWFQFMRPM